MGQRAGMIIKSKGFLRDTFGGAAKEVECGKNIVALYNQWAYGYKLVRTLGHFGRYMQSNTYEKNWVRPETLVTIASYIQRPLEDGVHVSNWVFEEIAPLSHWDNNDGFLLLDLSLDNPKYAILNSSLKQQSLKNYLKSYKEVTELKNEIKTLQDDMKLLKEMSEDEVKEFLLYLEKDFRIGENNVD